MHNQLSMGTGAVLDYFYGGNISENEYMLLFALFASLFERLCRQST